MNALCPAKAYLSGDGIGALVVTDLIHMGSYDFASRKFS